MKQPSIHPQLAEDVGLHGRTACYHDREEFYPYDMGIDPPVEEKS